MSLKKLYQNISKGAFWTTLLISIILIVVSFILPPQGQIDPTVMGAVGELFAFGTLATVIEGLHRGADVTVEKGQTKINIQNPDKQ